MHSYKELRKSNGSRISQTLDSPIMFADLWDLSDILTCLASILIFGLVFYSWVLLLLSLIWTLIANPMIKRKFNRGFLLHLPYRLLNMKLNGLVNPGKGQRFSD